MPKDKELAVVEGEAPSPMAPATYTLVDIDPNATIVHIPLLGREYKVAELKENLGLLELLHNQGWPGVEKTP